jgi:hypothetical protein
MYELIYMEAVLFPLDVDVQASKRPYKITANLKNRSSSFFGELYRDTMFTVG